MVAVPSPPALPAGWHVHRDFYRRDDGAACVWQSVGHWVQAYRNVYGGYTQRGPAHPTSRYAIATVDVVLLGAPRGWLLGDEQRCPGGYERPDRLAAVWLNGDRWVWGGPNDTGTAYNPHPLSHANAGDTAVQAAFICQQVMRLSSPPVALVGGQRVPEPATPPDPADVARLQEQRRWLRALPALPAPIAYLSLPAGWAQAVDHSLPEPLYRRHDGACVYLSDARPGCWLWLRGGSIDEVANGWYATALAAMQACDRDLRRGP